MPRPALTEERTTLILDAFARCVARQGLDATSLENVADEAGVKRSILRHYIGNRDDLVQALVHRVLSNYRKDVAVMVASLPSQRTAHGLLDYLFWDGDEATGVDVQVVEAMIAASGRDDRLRDMLKTWIDEFNQVIAEILARDYPGAETQRCWDVAYGVVSIYYNHEALAPLHLPNKYRLAARQSAEALIETLKPKRNRRPTSLEQNHV